MRQETKLKIAGVLGAIIGTILGPSIFLIFVIPMLFGYYPCPKCWRLIKRGEEWCSHCYSKIAWRLG